QGDGRSRNRHHAQGRRSGRTARDACRTRSVAAYRAGAAGIRDDGNDRRSRRERPGPLGRQRHRGGFVSLPREFRSDNAAPAHPAVVDAIVAANSGSAGAYGADQWTARATDWFKAEFGDASEAFLVWNGTGANVTAIR